MYSCFLPWPALGHDLTIYAYQVTEVTSLHHHVCIFVEMGVLLTFLSWLASNQTTIPSISASQVPGIVAVSHFGSYCMVFKTCILNVVLICIPVMAKDAEHLFTCVLIICISSFDNCLFTSFAHMSSFVDSLGV
jgi:hypothetical protein